MMNNYFIKANRIFTSWRKWAWIFTLVVAFGGLYEPKLGLLVLPVIVGLVSTAFFTGRFWCGNICAHGSLYDHILIKYSKNKKIPKFLKSKLLIIAFFMWFGGKITFKLIKIFTNLSGMLLLDKLGLIFVSSYLMVLIIGIPIGIIYTPRSWCRFCPMGTMQRLSYKLGKLLGVAKKTEKKVTILSKDLCHGCAKCSRVCPMQLTPHKEFDENNQFNSEKCIKCKTCIENCPAKILSLEKTEAAISKRFDIESKMNLSKVSIDAQIKKINYLAKDVMEIIFNLGDNEFPYTAGQFVLIEISNSPVTKRAYTVSGYDKEKNELRLTIKKVNKGLGTEIIFNNFKVGQLITIEGPMGHELITDEKCQKIILVAAGIGITPFIPILEDLKQHNCESNITLIYGARYEKELYYRNEIEALINNEKNMYFIPVVSRDKNFNGYKGYVTDVLEKMDITGSKIYMCASKQVAQSTEELLKSKTFDMKNFFVETA